MPSHQLSKEACLLIGEKKLKYRDAQPSVQHEYKTQVCILIHRPPRLVHTCYPFISLHLTYSFSFLTVDCCSPPDTSFCKQDSFFPTFTVKLFGSKLESVFKLLYNSYVALFKCSLSLLDEKLCDFMLSKNTRQQYVFIFRCLVFLKILRGLPLFFILFVSQTYSSLGTK